MAVDARLRSAKDRAMLAIVLAQDFPESTRTQSGGDTIDPVSVAACLKQLAEKCLYLTINARNNDLDDFMVKLAEVSQLAATVNKVVPFMRERWAVAAQGKLGVAMTFRCKAQPRGHMALFEWCREVHFAVMAGADIEGLLACVEGNPGPEFDHDSVRKNWRTVRSVLAALEETDPRDFFPQIEAEIGVMGFAATTGSDESPEGGPVVGHRWRHNGLLIEDQMQDAAHRMVDFLWATDGRAASFDELKIPVYGDIEHLADANAFGSLRKAANRYFNKHEIPLVVSLNKTTVILSDK